MAGSARSFTGRRLELGDDLAATCRVGRRNRENHLADAAVADQLVEPVGRIDADAADVAAPEVAVVVEKGGDVVAVLAAQGLGELRAGGAGAIDDDARGLADVALGQPQGVFGGKTRAGDNQRTEHEVDERHGAREHGEARRFGDEQAEHPDERREAPWPG